MAIDVALAQWSAKSGIPVVRVYRFVPPTLSLGRFQRTDEVYLPGLREIGAGLCRRPTGGQAVLHDDEVTYAIACPRRLLSERVLESYERIAAGLIRALAALGVVAEVAVRETELRREANCFLWPAPAEIVASGKKLLGSAQCRMGAAFLQHGALPLTLDAGRWAAVFAPPAERERVKREMAQHATSLQALLGRRPDPAEVEVALLAGLASVFEGPARPLPPSVWSALNLDERPFRCAGERVAAPELDGG